jgi:myo-inositol 2-dehydrogenase/D-chiro-inositol 1-dehydrogenase
MKRRVFLKNAAAATAGAVTIPTVVPSSVFGKSAPSNKIQIGQIGCGRIARGHDLPGTMRWDIARVIAVSDLDSNRM